MPDIAAGMSAALLQSPGTVGGVPSLTPGEEKIRMLLLGILKKIVLMDIAHGTYALLAKIVLYGHYLIGAILLLLLAIIRGIGNAGIVENVGIALTTVITLLPKFREYLQYEPTRDKAKEQLGKYSELFDRIENNIRALDYTNASKVEQFEIAASFEVRRLEIDDPDVSGSVMKKYNEYCAAKNISTDDVGTKIQMLLGKLAPLAPTVAAPLAAPLTSSVAVASSAAATVGAPPSDDTKNVAADISFSERSILPDVTPMGTLTRQTFRQYQKDIETRDKSAWIAERLKALT